MKNKIAKLTIQGKEIVVELGHTMEEWKEAHHGNERAWGLNLEEYLSGDIAIIDGMPYWYIDGKLCEADFSGNVYYHRYYKDNLKECFINFLKERGGEIHTFGLCSSEGMGLDDSTIDMVVLDGSDIQFVYNENLPMTDDNFDYFEYFDKDEMCEFYTGLVLHYDEYQKNIEDYE